MEFIHACVERQQLLEVDSYLVVGKTAAQEFSSGKIMGEERTSALLRGWVKVLGSGVL